MNQFEKFYVRVSSIFPPKFVKTYEQVMIEADIKINARIYIGFTFLLSLLLGFVSIMFLLSLGFHLIIGVPGGIFIGAVLMVFFYYRVILTADARGEEVEKYLPDALQLISANIRAGMTVDKALWLCARPEFGPFEKELKKMASETLGGKPVTVALAESASRVRSTVLGRAYLLLTQGIQLGGALANLLVEIASDIRTNQALKREITAATTMYTIFILFSSVLAAPTLFAVSTFYVEATGKIWLSQDSGNAETQSAAQSGMQEISVLKVSPEEMLSVDEVRFFAVACILITTFFGSLTIGLIKFGEAKKGLRYVPFFVTGALAIYFIAFAVIGGMFNQILV